MSTYEKPPALSLVGEPQIPASEKLERPRYAVYEDPCTVEGKFYKAGTWYHGLKQSGPDEKAIPVDHWICVPLNVMAETINSEDGSIGLLVNFSHRGKHIELVIPREVIGSKGDEVLKSLLSRGLVIEYHQRRQIVPYLASHQSPDLVIATTGKPGWHESGAFVLPSRVIGGDNVRFQDSGRAASIFNSKGTADGWQAEIAVRCVGNPVLILSVCCALAGPLLAKVGVNGGGAPH